jgi:Fe-S cluster assembly protein SufD
MTISAKQALAQDLLAARAAPRGEAAWAQAVREAAVARLTAMGGPIRRDEYWKYTDPAPLTARAPVADIAEVTAADTAAPVLAAVDTATFVFVNGRLRPDLSLDGVEGAEVLSLARALGADISFAKPIFGRLEEAGHEKVARPLAALNTARATEGLAIRVSAPLARPLHLRHVEVGPGAAMLHHVVRIESGAVATLIETGAPTSTVMEIDIAPGGVLHHLRVQTGERQPAVTHLFARVGEGATFKTFTLTEGGKLTRNEVVFDLVGDDAVGHCAGTILASGDTHIDNTVFVTHSGLRGESRQVFKSVLDGQGRSVFQGKIFVRPTAQKTDGYQLSQSILLSDTAEFDVKPELEIYADDVKCSHGTTTGAMDETALYYLRSRGIPRRQAEAMLVEAFADEAIAEIEDDTLAQAMRGLVAEWMARR